MGAGPSRFGLAVVGLLAGMGCARVGPDAGEVTPLPEPTSATTSAPSTSPGPADVGPTRAVNEQDLLPAALAAIAAAGERIRIAQFVIYDGAAVDELLEALEEAAARGVRVQLLADEEGDETAAVLERLSLAGVEARLDSPEVVLHNKLIVADEVALVGSHNWTWSALTANQEASALVADEEVAGWYAAWFDAVWEDPAAEPELAPLARRDLQPLADRAVVDAALGCLEGAQERIEVVMYAVAWDDRYPGSAVDRVLGAIEAAHGRGVEVAVVVDGSEWIVDNGINDAAVARLRSAGIDVWRTRPSPTTHAKVLRCDDVVLVSDANWSYSGLELDHGTSLLATEPDLVAQMEGWIHEVRSDAAPVP